MIRQARFTDIPRMVELVAEMHARSRYAAVSDVDNLKVRSILTQSLQRDGGTGSGATRAQVAMDDGGKVQGFIIGILTPLYDIGTALLATDWMFYLSERGRPQDAFLLLDSVIAWADANPRVKIQRYGVMDAIEDFTRTGKLYAKRGFRQAGAIWERETIPTSVGAAA